MVKYENCGHETDGVIILDDNIMSMTAYLEWAESVGINGDKTRCWECWNKPEPLMEETSLSEKKEELELMLLANKISVRDLLIKFKELDAETVLRVKDKKNQTFIDGRAYIGVWIIDKEFGPKLSQKKK